MSIFHIKFVQTDGHTDNSKTTPPHHSMKGHKILNDNKGKNACSSL